MRRTRETREILGRCVLPAGGHVPEDSSLNLGLGTLVALLVASTAAAQPPVAGAALPLSPRNANYSIDARLDTASRTVTASEVITWRNVSMRPATDLQFHLYWNAWRDNRSTWLREEHLVGRHLSPPPAEDLGHIEVNSIQLLASTPPVTSGPVPVDLTASKHFIAPDDGNRDDATVIAVPLPQPVPPSGTITVEVKWSAHVPRAFSRTGAIGNFFFLGQWFPKLGVLQNTGWNCHQFHSSTEFFSDYGVYDVRLTVPKGWVVGATGIQRERRENADGTTTHRYSQEDVHDFAWTTSPDFIERTARFDNPPLPPVDMRLLLQPEHADQAERHFDATRTALRYYGEWYGAYPYGHITIVDPAYQSGAGGMEYPTLFTAGTRWLVVPHVATLEQVTIHEAGHQFWHGIVGNNEFEDAWMDEGIDEFSTARVIAAAYDPNHYSRRYFGGFIPYAFKDVVLRRETDGSRLQIYRAVADIDVQSTPSYRYFPTAGSGITYGKTALWLNTMERWLGWPTLQRILTTYFARWKFRHPTPHDFFDVVNDVTGRDLSWYFDQVYRSSNVFDYAVGSLRSVAAGNQFRTMAVVRRNGEAIFPVDVLVTFQGGDRVTEHWDGRDRWKLYTYDRPSRALSAEVDPDRVLLLDVNYTNNSRTLAPRGGTASTRWATKWMVWLQDALLSWSFFV